jgi:AcrR family transcriptional regulator
MPKAKTQTRSRPARSAGRPRSETSSTSIVQTAFRFLQRRPVAEISIMQIAQEAGVSKATVYRWWSTKEALLLDAFLYSLRREVVLEHTGAPLSRLKAYILDTGAVFAGKNGIVIARLITAIQDNPTLRKEFLRRVYSPHDEEIRAVVEEAIERGDLPKNLDVATFLDSIFGPLTVRLLLRNEKIDPAFVATVFENVVAGARAQRTEAS